jgi:hypothetical protein
VPASYIGAPIENIIVVGFDIIEYCPIEFCRRADGEATISFKQVDTRPGFGI